MHPLMMSFHKWNYVLIFSSQREQSDLQVFPEVMSMSPQNSSRCLHDFNATNDVISWMLINKQITKNYLEKSFEIKRWTIIKNSHQSIWASDLPKFHLNEQIMSRMGVEHQSLKLANSTTIGCINISTESIGVGRIFKIPFNISLGD